MFNSICTFGGVDKCYSVIDFQKLPEKEIEKLRHSLVCPGCREQAFCRENTLSPQRQREVRNASEVQQIIAESDTIIISFNFDSASSAGSEPSGFSEKTEITGTGHNKVHTIKSEQKRVPTVSLQKILHSLIRGTGLATSDTIIPFGDFKYKAKNLFVKFPDAEPMTKNALRFYWGRYITRTMILNGLILLNAGMLEYP